jgi:hypothetical protein
MESIEEGLMKMITAVHPRRSRTPDTVSPCRVGVATTPHHHIDPRDTRKVDQLVGLFHRRPLVTLITVQIGATNLVMEWLN